MPTSPVADTAKPTPTVKTFWLIREAFAPKLSPRSNGRIKYQILTDQSRQTLFLRIAGNEGGGQFSDEAVPVQALRSCVNQHPADQPMRAAALKSAFVGRSSNQPPFGAAILLAEGLLQRDSERAGVLIDGSSWQAWADAQMAAAVGDLSEVKVGKELVIRPEPRQAPAPIDAVAQERGCDVAGVIHGQGDTDSVNELGDNSATSTEGEGQAVSIASVGADEFGQPPADDDPPTAEPKAKKGRARTIKASASAAS